MILEEKSQLLSKDFELVKKNVLNTTIAKKYLKSLDSRMIELNLTYE